MYLRFTLRNPCFQDEGEVTLAVTNLATGNVRRFGPRPLDAGGRTISILESSVGERDELLDLSARMKGVCANGINLGDRFDMVQCTMRRRIQTTPGGQLAKATNQSSQQGTLCSGDDCDDECVAQDSGEVFTQSL